MKTENRAQKINEVVKNRQSGLVVVLEDVHDPHNVAAVLRTCDAFGIQDVYLIFDKVKPYNPRKIGKRSSSSANKWIDFHIFNSSEQAITELRSNGYSIVTTALTENAESIYEIDLTQDKLALVFGNEHAGVSDYLLSNSDALLMIPMYGFVQSLNISVSAAITIFATLSQRIKSGNDYSLDSKTTEQLTKDFFSR